MPFPLPPAPRVSLAVSLAAYAVGAALAGIVTVYAAYRVGSAVLARAPVAAPPAAQATAVVRRSPIQVREVVRRSRVPVTAVATAAPVADAAARPVTVVRQASMTPSQERWRRSDSLWAPDRYAPPTFGTSSRDGGRTYGGERPAFAARGPRDDDDDDRTGYGGSYRTLCVRLCDGFYFPVSFATDEERFEHDAQVCERRCGAQARLYVHANPGGDIEDMQDLEGRPYRRLATAFLYRTQYLPACTCQPHPWEAQAQDRHRLYALTAARAKGGRQAAGELEELHRRQPSAPRAGHGKAQPVPAPVLIQSGTVPTPARPPADPAAARPAADPRLGAGEGGRMGLGAGAEPKSTRAAPAFERRYEPDFDWRRRALQMF